MIKYKGAPAQELTQRNKEVVKLIKQGVRKEKIAVQFDLNINRIYQIYNSYKKRQAKKKKKR